MNKDREIEGYMIINNKKIIVLLEKKEGGQRARPQN